VLGGDVDWKELGFSPKDMDFAQMKAQAAREISSAFGVPHLLVVAGAATYNNRADARLELWEHTVIPLLDRLSSALTTWLAPMFGYDLRLAHDLDEVPALAPRRRMKWQQIQAADFLTLNEKREALGYAPVAMAVPRGREAKNSVNFLRLHGYPQPRDDRSRFAVTAIARDSDLDGLVLPTGLNGLTPFQRRVVSELYRVMKKDPLDLEGIGKILSQLGEEIPPELKTALTPPKTMEELRPNVERKGFDTPEALIAYLNANVAKPPGFEWHHVIPAEQPESDWLTDELKRRFINNTRNIVLIPTMKHMLITAFMNSKMPGTGLLRRQVAARYDLDTQKHFGESLLILFRCLKW
jgi:hypothetical protein